MSLRAVALVLASASALLATAFAVQARPAKRHAVPTSAARLAPEGPAYGERADVLRFAEEAAASEPTLDPGRVAQALATARYQPAVARFIMPAATPSAKNWAAYRARFVDARRIQAGQAFWQANEAWLRQAEARWGVPPQIVVAIIGIETLYGQQTGGFRAIDALATLSFDFPRGRSDRSAFFRDELRHLLVLAERAGVDPASLRGSYAGAMGMPQFMPSTWRQYAVDFDGDGRIDLHSDAADVIGSVAGYLAGYGWQRGLATHFDVVPPAAGPDLAVLLGPDILPSFTAAEFEARGALLTPAGRAHPGLLALVELSNGDAAPSHIAGTENFWAVTRYNWSSYYAMAVIELAQALDQAMSQRDTRVR